MHRRGSVRGAVDDQLDVRRDVEQGLVVVQGAVDLATVDRFREQLLTACHHAPSNLVVDLAATTFLCVRGSGVLATCREELRARDRELILRGATREVRRALDVCGRPCPEER